MAGTAVTKISGTQLQVTYTSLGANWNIDSDLTSFKDSGIRVKSIQFDPSAASDVLLVRNKAANGAVLMKVKCSGDTDQRVKYLGGDKGKTIFPYIVLSEQSFTTPASVIISFDLA